MADRVTLLENALAAYLQRGPGTPPSEAEILLLNSGPEVVISPEIAAAMEEELMRLDPGFDPVSAHKFIQSLIDSSPQ